MQSPSPAFDQFRALVERDPALREQLYRPDDPAMFVALVAAAAHDLGCGLDAAEVEAAITANRQAPVAVHGARLPPAGWLPVRAGWRDREFMVEWGYLGPRRLCEPFFEDSVLRCRSKPFNRLFRYATPIDALPDWLRRNPGLPPAGFIFHMSRCGSTLVAQMLAAIPRNVVVSEAAPIDAVVQARRQRPDLGDEQQAAWLGWMIGALGQPRSGRERHVFVKLDSWHALALPLFRRAFPAVPWLFLYRQPLEILVSQLRRRGMHMVPGALGADAFGIDASQSAQPPEAYCALVLERIGEAVLRDDTPDRGLLVDYKQLPAALWTSVLPHFGVPCSADDAAAMAEAARYDAKNPDLRFKDDRAAKHDAATAPIRSAAQRLGAVHARLEARAAARSPTIGGDRARRLPSN